jgi:hypothetical protein
MTTSLPIVNKEFLQSRSYESEIIKNITKKNFYTTLKVKGFDPENLLFIKKFTFDAAKKLNKCLRKTHRVMKIHMFDMIIFLDEDYMNMDTLINILDEKNKQTIRNECAKHFNITDGDTILFDVLT